MRWQFLTELNGRQVFAGSVWRGFFVGGSFGACLIANEARL